MLFCSAWNGGSGSYVWFNTGHQSTMCYPKSSAWTYQCMTSPWHWKLIKVSEVPGYSICIKKYHYRHDSSAMHSLPRTCLDRFLLLGKTEDFLGKTWMWYDHMTCPNHLEHHLKLKTDMSLSFQCAYNAIKLETYSHNSSKSFIASGCKILIIELRFQCEETDSYFMIWIFSTTKKLVSVMQTSISRDDHTWIQQVVLVQHIESCKRQHFHQEQA